MIVQICFIYPSNVVFSYLDTRIFSAYCLCLLEELFFSCLSFGIELEPCMRESSVFPTAATSFLGCIALAVFFFP